MMPNKKDMISREKENAGYIVCFKSENSVTYRQRSVSVPGVGRLAGPGERGLRHGPSIRDGQMYGVGSEDS